MGVYVSDEFDEASHEINWIMKIIVVAAIPGVVIGLILVFSPFFCCCCAFGDKLNSIHTKVIEVAEYIFCFLKRDKTRFIIYGYRAPACYTYYLLLMTVIISLHCFLTFWETAFHHYINEYFEKYDKFKHYRCIDVFNVTGLESINNSRWREDYKLTQNFTCIEIEFTKALEDAGTTFGFSALSFAIVTWLLLNVTKGDRIRKCISPINSVISAVIVIIVQIAGLCGPRYLLLQYLARIYKKENGFLNPPPAITDDGSFFSIIAIFDAISMSMLTPWMSFEELEKDSYDVSSPV